MNGNKGFTIIELTIATAVFSVILLLSLAGFLQIAQLFYKGVNITQTTEVGKQVMLSLKSDIAFEADPAAITRNGPSAATSPSGTVQRYWYCIGANRYAYTSPARQLDKEAGVAERNSTSPVGWYRFALLKDAISTTGCPNPFSGTSAMSSSTATELIGDRMRLSDFRISALSAPNDKLYTVTVKVAYGEDGVFQTGTATTTNPRCLSNPAFSRYCFVTQFNTVARKGL